MKSFLVLLLALLVVSSQSAEQTVRRRVQSSEVNKRGARGASTKYENLSEEIEVDSKNRVQRRFLQEKGGDKEGKGGDKEAKGAGKSDDVEEAMSMSMSMSMSLSMSM